MRTCAPRYAGHKTGRRGFPQGIPVYCCLRIIPPRSFAHTRAVPYNARLQSANYCHPDPANPYGLLLLCDVALGDMYERYLHTDDDYWLDSKKQPQGKESTKGMHVHRHPGLHCSRRPQGSVRSSGRQWPFSKGREIRTMHPPAHDFPQESA